MLPSFLLIGPGRAGTTTVYEALRAHPEVCLARGTKEVNFFNREYHRGIGWYEAFFRGCSGAKAIGEVSNLYLFSGEVPSRVCQHIPDVKLITVLRNPYERLVSAFAFRKSRGEIDRDIELKDALLLYPDLAGDNFYADHLESYLSHFPRDQVFVGLFDDLVMEQSKFLSEICSFIGVDPSSTSEVPVSRQNRRAVLRHPVLAPAVRRAADGLRAMGWHSTLDLAKRSTLLRGLLYRPGAHAEMLPGSLAAQLSPQFDSQIERVEELIGRSLSHWKMPRDDAKMDRTGQEPR